MTARRKTVRPRAWNTDIGKRRENEWTQNIDFCLGNSLRFSTKGWCWVWGALQGLDALLYHGVYNVGGFMSKWWGEAMALELPRQDNMAETGWGAWLDSWYDHIPALWSRAGPLTSPRISSICWEREKMICFVVKIKQGSSRLMVGDFTSLYMEELMAGSAHIFCTDIIHRGSQCQVGAHQHLWVSFWLVGYHLGKSLKGFKQRKNVVELKLEDITLSALERIG